MLAVDWASSLLLRVDSDPQLAFFVGCEVWVGVWVSAQ